MLGGYQAACSQFKPNYTYRKADKKMKSNFYKKREHKSQRKMDAQKGLEQMAFVLNGQDHLWCTFISSFDSCFVMSPSALWFKARQTQAWVTDMSLRL